MAQSPLLYAKRKEKVRYKIKKVNSDRLRLTIFKSNAHIYAQLIDDIQSITIVAASTLEKDLRSTKNAVNIERAKEIGKLVAQRAIAKGVTNVVFDRSGYLYHGRVKALAEAAREHGLVF